MAPSPASQARSRQGRKTHFRALGFAAQAAVLALLVALTGLLSETEDRGAAQSSGDQVAGRVIGINTAATPPLIQLGGTGAMQTAYFATVEALSRSGLRFGDSVLVRGQRLSDREIMVAD